MKPTIGRIVIFHVSTDDAWPAIVTKVWDENTGCCNLTVFPWNGPPELRTSVAFTNATVAPPEVNCWSWPVKV